MAFSSLLHLLPEQNAGWSTINLHTHFKSSLENLLVADAAAAAAAAAFRALLTSWERKKKFGLDNLESNKGCQKYDLIKASMIC